MSDGPAGTVNAEMTFTSTQTAELGPNGQTCSRWDLVYTMVGPGPDWRIRLAEHAAPTPSACYQLETRLVSATPSPSPATGADHHHRGRRDLRARAPPRPPSPAWPAPTAGSASCRAEPRHRRFRRSAAVQQRLGELFDPFDGHQQHDRAAHRSQRIPIH